MHIDAIMPKAMYKKPLESKVVLKVKVRLICLFESKSNNMKSKRKIKTLNEIAITKFFIKKNEITPKIPLNINLNGNDIDLFSGVDVDKDSIYLLVIYNDSAFYSIDSLKQYSQTYRQGL